mmetsp:Transcript_14472/g.30969  ORF Transcript_14472/g.30969 Transcript_14472/m.30969 type:complete len:670 (-) Transcript_14472:406-2415(-)
MTTSDATATDEKRTITKAPRSEQSPRAVIKRTSTMEEMPDLVEIASRMAKNLDIRPRMYFFKTYDDCFIGEDAVKWMVDTGVTRSVMEALDLGNRLQLAGFLDHVTKEHNFENKMLFYRMNPAVIDTSKRDVELMKRDAPERELGLSSNTSPKPKQLKPPAKDGQAAKGAQARKSCINDKEVQLLSSELDRLKSLALKMSQAISIADRKYGGTVYERCFIGEEAVRWMVESGVATNPRSAVALANRMRQAGLVQHVHNEHLFENANLFYTFNLESAHHLSSDHRTVCDGMQLAGWAVNNARLRTLYEVRKMLVEPQRNFLASATPGFCKGSFCFGVATSYASAYVFGRYPGAFWRYHVLSVLFMVPVQVHRWRVGRKLGYLLEYCWVVSIASALYLGYLWLALALPAVPKPPLFVREAMGLAIFATGMGPMACTTLVRKMPMVPHSIDHTMSFIIHHHLLLSAFSTMFRPHTGDMERLAFGYLNLRDKSFLEYAAPAVVMFAAWWTVHQVVLQVWGAACLGVHQSKYGRSFVQDMLNPPGKRHSPFTRVFGKICQDGSLTTRDRARVLAYSTVQGSLTVLAICASYVPYKYDTAEGGGSLAWILLVVLGALYHGAGWYWHAMRGFTKVMDDIITIPCPGPRPSGEREPGRRGPSGAPVRVPSPEQAKTK